MGDPQRSGTRGLDACSGVQGSSRGSSCESELSSHLVLERSYACPVSGALSRTLLPLALNTLATREDSVCGWLPCSLE